MKTLQIARKLIEVEIKYGFLYVPSHGVKYFPAQGQKIKRKRGVTSRHSTIEIS